MFQANQEALTLFAPWFQVMEMQINLARSTTHARARSEPGPQAEADSRRRSFSTARRRPRSAASPPLSTNWFETATIEGESRAFRWSDSSCAGAWMISCEGERTRSRNCVPYSSDQVGRCPHARHRSGCKILAVRGQELDLIGKAEKLIAENADLSVRLTAAVDRLVSGGRDRRQFVRQEHSRFSG